MLYFSILALAATLLAIPSITASPASSISVLANWISVFRSSPSLQVVTEAWSAPPRLAKKLPEGLDLLSATIQDLQKYLGDGSVTSVQLVQAYLDNIEANNLQKLNLRAIIETAPYDNIISIAQSLDVERARGAIRSGLHGIPILVKDNMATDPILGMNTTAGSHALLGYPVPKDAHIVSKLRAAGAIILAKANLSAFSNYYGNITNGWSPRGGQCQSVYVRGGFEKGGDPCGSSAGSGVGVSAGFGAAALGSETDGSITCPSSAAALYGIKMTVGLSSRTGIVPISWTQDTGGPMAKSAYDCALILENMVGRDDEDEATFDAFDHMESNYTKYATAPLASFEGMKLGFPSNMKVSETPDSNETEFLTALERMSSLGATVMTDFEFPHLPPTNWTDKPKQGWASDWREIQVLDTEIKVYMERYLKDLGGNGPKTLEDLINYNDKHADTEFEPGHCCQQLFIRAVQSQGLDDPEYISAKADNLKYGGTDGIDAVLDRYQLDALVLPFEGYAVNAPAIAGYPIVVVPYGVKQSTGRPWGIAFIGRKWSEGILISLMAASEAAFPPRALPAQLIR